MYINSPDEKPKKQKTINPNQKKKFLVENDKVACFP